MILIDRIDICTLRQEFLDPLNIAFSCHMDQLAIFVLRTAGKQEANEQGWDRFVIYPTH
jgi:hypothetical protein